MGCESNALLLELGRNRTGIGLTGLDTVRDQHNRGWIVPKGQGFGGLDHRVGQGRLAPRGDAIDGRQERICIHRPRRDHQFDITTVAFASVAIGHEPQIGRLRPGFNQIGHDLAGSLDLGDAIDLPPHRVRAVIHDHHILGGRGRDSRKANQERQSNGSVLHAYVFRANGIGVPAAQMGSLRRLCAADASVPVRSKGKEALKGTGEMRHAPIRRQLPSLMRDTANQTC